MVVFITVRLPPESTSMKCSTGALRFIIILELLRINLPPLSIIMLPLITNSSPSTTVVSFIFQSPEDGGDVPLILFTLNIELNIGSLSLKDSSLVLTELALGVESSTTGLLEIA